MTFQPHLPQIASAEAIQERHHRARIKLIRLREARGLSRPELAKILGMSRVTVWRVENGFVTPQIEEMAQWLKVLRCDVDDLSLFIRPKKV